MTATLPVCEWPRCGETALVLYATSCAHGHCTCHAACAGHLTQALRAAREHHLACLHGDPVTSLIYSPIYSPVSQRNETRVLLYDEHHQPIPEQP